MDKRYLLFNVIVFLILIIVFNIGSGIENSIDYIFAGNSWINPVTSESYDFTGIILQVFSVSGILIQLIYLNKKLITNQ